MNEKELANRVIDALGGTMACAEICGIKPPSVSAWRTSGIPKPWRKYLMCAYPQAFEQSTSERAA